MLHLDLKAAACAALAVTLASAASLAAAAQGTGTGVDQHRAVAAGITRAATRADQYTLPLKLAMTPARSAGSTVPYSTELSPGVAQSIAGKGGSKTFFTIQVPEGANGLDLQLLRGDGSGDPDLYVSGPGSVPTESDYDCMSNSDANDDCSFINPVPGTYTIMVWGFQTYHGYQIKGDYTIGDPIGLPASYTELQSGVPVAVSGAAGSENIYRIAVPEGTYSLMLTSNGGSGEVALYESFEQDPRLADYSCGPDGAESQTCQQNYPGVGDWYIEVYGMTDFSDITLTASTVAAQPLTELQSGVPLDGIAMTDCCDAQFYQIEVPEGATRLTVQTTGGEGGDAFLYVSGGELPKWWDADCSSDNFSSAEESCEIDDPVAGTYYIGLQAWVGFTDLSLTATVTSDDDDEGGGYIGPNCPTGFEQRKGRLEQGETAVLPFKASRGASALGVLRVQEPSDAEYDVAADYDLYLERFIAGEWKVIAAANSSNANETIRLPVLPKGKMRWLVAAYDESRQYLLCSRVTP